MRRNINRNYPKNGRDQLASNHLIELRNVYKLYEGGAGEFAALKGVNLMIDEGEYVAVIGKSGSGKSTLLNMITGIDRPTRGEVVINNTPIHLLSEGKTAVWRGKNMGIVFQFFQLLPTLTVVENIMLPMDFGKKYSLKERKERALYLLDEVELIEQANKLPSELSGGQQQRVAIARALANNPPILVADEPTGNLDSKTADAVFRLFTRLVDFGKTILMVTHDQDLAQRVSRIISLVDGNVVFDNKSVEYDPKKTNLFIDQVVNKEEIDLEVETVKGDLVKSSKVSQPTTDIVQKDGKSDALRLRVRKILADHKNGAHLLNTEFVQTSGDSEKMDALYKIVIEEVSMQANEAENNNHPEESRRLWKVVMEATESWVDNNAD